MPDLKSVIIVMVGFVLAGGVCPGQEAAAERVEVRQLLDKYAEAQKGLRSYVVQVQKTELDVVRPVDGAVKERSISYKEVRTDGGKFYVEERTPTDMLKEKAVVTPGDVVSATWLWDGQLLYWYARYSEAYAREAKIRPNGVVIIYNDPRDTQLRDLVAQHRPGALGQLLGVGDGRIDAVLRGTQTVSVRDEMESVAGSECYIIDAIVYARRTRFKYKVWLDPGHGYNVAKAMVWMPKGVYSSYGNVIFRQVGDVWAPASYEAQERRSEPLNGDEMLRSQVRVTELALNPDHKERGSFVPKPNDGADVVIRGRGGVERRGFKWMDGKVMDAKGNEVDCRPAKENQKPR